MSRKEETGEVPAVQPDAWLVAKVTATFLFHRNLSASETEVVADKGTITLRGEASSRAQKYLATKLVSDDRGVKSVTSNMTVEQVKTEE